MYKFIFINSVIGYGLNFMIYLFSKLMKSEEYDLEKDVINVVSKSFNENISDHLS